MLGPIEFALNCLQRFIFGNDEPPPPPKEDDSPYVGMITFSNCRNDCPGNDYFKAPINCQIDITGSGLKLEWDKHRYKLNKEGTFELKFLKSGQIECTRQEFIHECFPRTYEKAIQLGDENAVDKLLERNLEPTEENYQEAVALDHQGIAEKLRERLDLGDFELV